MPRMILRRPKLRRRRPATAMRALRHGVPIVATPGFAGDQPDVAAAVAIRSTIRRVAAGPSSAARAKESAAWPVSDGAAKPAVEAERLLSKRKGAPRGRLRPRRNPAREARRRRRAPPPAARRIEASFGV